MQGWVWDYAPRWVQGCSWRGGLIELPFSSRILSQQTDTIPFPFSSCPFIWNPPKDSNYHSANMSNHSVPSGFYNPSSLSASPLQISQEVLSLPCSPSHWDFPIKQAPPTSIRPTLTVDLTLISHPEIWNANHQPSWHLKRKQNFIQEKARQHGTRRDTVLEARSRRTWNKC